MSDYYVSLRPAQASDVELCFHWRNDPLSVKYSISQRPVAWQDHKQWFAAQHKFIHICLHQEAGFGGMIRVEPVDFGFAGYSAELSWIVAPPFRGLGIGKMMLGTCLAAHCSNITVGAKIMKTNEASVAIAERNGFQLWREGEFGVGTYLKKPIGV